MNIVDKIKKLINEKLNEVNTFDLGKITAIDNSKLQYNVKLKHKIEGKEIELFNVPLAPFRFNAGMVLISLDIDDIVGIAFSKHELKQQLKNKDIVDVNEILKFDINNAMIISGAFTDVDEIPDEFGNGIMLLKHKSGSFIKFDSDGNLIINDLTQGDIFYVNASGYIVKLAAGTDGWFLKTQGAGANPLWASVGGGGDMFKSTYDTGDNGIVDNSEKLESSTKAQVQDHTPKAHTLASHSSKPHSELTGVGVSDHHVKYTDAEALVQAKANIEDAPVNGHTEQGASSNWAFDHVAAADPHTGYVLETLFDAYSLLYADTDNLPARLTVAASRFVGRKASGGIAALTAAEVKTLLSIAITDISDIPGTIASILTDHDKTAHDALNIDADQVDGEEAADIVTNNRVKAHFPDIITNILSDHNKAAHDALDIAPASHGVDKHTNVTRKIFIPFTNISGTLTRAVESIVVQLDGVGEEVGGSLEIPTDFVSSPVLKAIYICGTTSNGAGRFYAAWAAHDEGYQTHQESDTSVVYPMSIAMDIKTMDYGFTFANLAVGDILRFYESYNSANVLLLIGWIFEYTAEQ